MKRAICARRSRISDPVSPLRVCPECGGERIAAYCADCGRDVRPRKLSWREALEELVSDIGDLNAATLRSFGLIATRPGELALRRVENVGAPTVSPLKFFLILLLVYSIVFSIAPLRYGQLVIATPADLGAEGPDGAWGIYMVYFRPPFVAALLPGFLAGFADGRLADLDPDDAVLLQRMIDDPGLVDSWSGAFERWVRYIPLVFIALMLAAGLAVRRGRYVLEHLILGMEAVTALLLLILFTAGLLSLFSLAGVIAPSYGSFLTITMPLFALWLYLAQRRFYGGARWLAGLISLAVTAIYILSGDFLEAQLVQLVSLRLG
jgi:hypothetical protein